MKRLTHAALALFFVLAAAAAQASSLSPAATKFTLRGHVVVAAPGNDAKCDLLMKGDTGSTGRGKISSFKMSGAAPACTATPLGLSWKVIGNGLHGVRILKFGYQDAVADCAPSTAFPSVTDGGQWVFSFGSCFTGTLQSTPPITLVP